MIPFSRDLAERVLWTFFQAFFGVLSASWIASGVDVANLTDLGALGKLALAGSAAGVAAVISLVKGLIAKNIGQTGTASTVSVEKVTAVSESAPDVSHTETGTPINGFGEELNVYKPEHSA